MGPGRSSTVELDLVPMLEAAHEVGPTSASDEAPVANHEQSRLKLVSRVEKFTTFAPVLSLLMMPWSRWRCLETPHQSPGLMETPWRCTRDESQTHNKRTCVNGVK
jgi:hypothetical protein